MAERAIRKERNVWMGSDTESAKQMLLRARNTHAARPAVRRRVLNGLQLWMPLRHHPKPCENVPQANHKGHFARQLRSVSDIENFRH